MCDIEMMHVQPPLTMKGMCYTQQSRVLRVKGTEMQVGIESAEGEARGAKMLIWSGLVV